jgi:uncharacterized protein (TIGR03435 family)
MTLRAALASLLVLALLGTAAGAQRPAFDVASIVPTPAGVRVRTTYDVTPSGIIYRGVTIGGCIEAAYQVSHFEVSGPAWLNTARFDITARMAGPATKGQLMAMLQTLLAERFGLTLHREPREMRALALTVRRGGTKLTRGDQSGLANIISMGLETELKNHTMREVAHYLSRLGPIGMPVVDATGIDGRYDVVLNMAPLAAGKKADPTVEERDLAQAPVTGFSDTLQRYGLTLQSRKVPLEILVIDRAEMPTAN